MTLLMCSMFDLIATKSAGTALYIEMMGLIGAGNNPMVGMTEALSSCS